MLGVDKPLFLEHLVRAPRRGLPWAPAKASGQGRHVPRAEEEEEVVVGPAPRIMLRRRSSLSREQHAEWLETGSTGSSGSTDLSSCAEAARLLAGRDDNVCPDANAAVLARDKALWRAPTPVRPAYDLQQVLTAFAGPGHTWTADAHDVAAGTVCNLAIARRGAGALTFCGALRVDALFGLVFADCFELRPGELRAFDQCPHAAATHPLNRPCLVTLEGMGAAGEPELRRASAAMGVEFCALTPAGAWVFAVAAFA